MREKIRGRTEVPENDTDGYIPYHSIKDDVNSDEQTRFCVIFSTRRLLDFFTKSDVIHLDATYRLNWQGFPVMVVGVSSPTGKFFGSLVVLSSHEDHEAWNEINNYVHSLNVHPRYRMADGAQSITKSGREIFSNCAECKDSKRLMCWSHVYRAIAPQMKAIGALDKNIEKSLMSGIEDIQWSANDDNFRKLIDLLEEKFVKNSNYSSQVNNSLKIFFSYFRSVWVETEDDDLVALKM